jgi:hypothetical protein
MPNPGTSFTPLSNQIKSDLKGSLVFCILPVSLDNSLSSVLGVSHVVFVIILCPLDHGLYRSGGVLPRARDSN